MSDDVILVVSSDEESEPPAKVAKISESNGASITLIKVKKKTAQQCIENRNSVIKYNEKKSDDVSFTIVIADENNKQNGYNLDEVKEEPKEKNKDENNTSGDCLIVPSDSDPETSPKSNNKIIQLETTFLDRPSTSVATDTHKLFDEFLDVCTKSIRGSKYESKVLPIIPKLKNHFDKCKSIHLESSFQKTLMEYTVSAKISAPEAVISFQRFYSYLRDTVDGSSVEVADNDLPKLRKLEKMCKMLMKRIRKLEEMEVNFDDEDDSVYIQGDRYTKRLNKVYAKYCEILKRNPNTGRLLYEKFQFVHSKHNEINRAITKSYKHNKFPSYYDIEKVVRQCVQKHDLALRDDEIKEESKFCFIKIGNLLQMRRKKELYEVQCGYITLNEDPANNDDGLKHKLKENLDEGEKKMKEVIDKYAKLQDTNLNVQLSEDSDDSHYKSDSEPDS